MVMPSSLESMPSDPLLGQTLGGKYVLERLVGRGGMGHVYLARSEHGGEARTVTVKMIAPDLAAQPQAMARFEREAKRLDGLRHSNIVEMYDHGREGGRAYIVMEYVDGELLSDYMARHGRLTLAEFVPIAAQILKGVGHAHSRDLMIRDVKPANVMLCERKGRANFVKIIDFGLAKMLEGDQDITKQHFIGTSGYLSPEQIKGVEIDLRVDVYALGVLFYQMLSGRMPFEAENDTTLLYKHVHDFPTPLSEVLPADHQVPDELVHLIHDCLEKDPDQRPGDANEIVERLIDCVPMAMFRLPAAGVPTSITQEHSSISALSTSALAAPTGETAAYMRRDAVRETLPAGGSEPTHASQSTGETLTATASASHSVAAPAPKNKLGWIVGAVALLGAGLIAVLLLIKDDGEAEVDEPPAQAAAAPDAGPDTGPETGTANPAGDDAASSGTLEVSSEPSARLFIDGFPAGSTPYSKSLPIGRHTLELRAEGFDTWTREIEVKAAGNVPIDVALLPVPAAAGDPEPAPSGDVRPRPGRRNPGKGSKASSPPKQPTTPPDTASEPPPKPKADKPSSPFLPTKKDQDRGPFLPTQ